MAFKLDAKIPAGELAQKWSNHKAAIKVVSPANKRKLDIIIVGTGLGGASAAASRSAAGTVGFFSSIVSYSYQFIPTVKISIFPLRLWISI